MYQTPRKTTLDQTVIAITRRDGATTKTTEYTFQHVEFTGYKTAKDFQKSLTAAAAEQGFTIPAYNHLFPRLPTSIIFKPDTDSEPITFSNTCKYKLTKAIQVLEHGQYKAQDGSILQFI